MSLFFEILLGLIVGILSGYFYEFCCKFVERKLKKGTSLKIKGFYIHHSIYGVIIILIYLIIRMHFLLGLGLGIIIAHTFIEKKFVIIDKS